MRFKRAAAGLVASVMALTAVATPALDNLPFAVFADGVSVRAGAEEYGDFEYSVVSYDSDDGSQTVTITGYKGSDETVVIPSEIDGKTVTNIESYAFSGCTSLKEVTVPECVTEIGLYALGYILNDHTYSKVDGFKIKYVYGSYAHRYAVENGFSDEELFVTESYGDSDESNEVSITRYFGNSEKIVIPDEIDGRTVRKIGFGAFSDNKTVKSIELPDSVYTIEINAFDNCPLLSEVTIPESVTYIGENAFGYYRNDDYETVKKDGFVINYVKNSAGHLYAARNGFTDEECFYTTTDSEGRKCLEGYAGGKESIEIPDDVYRIGGRAFKGCDKLTSVTIPDSVKEIKYDAFLNCTSLKEITIPESVTYIEDHALGYIMGDDNAYVKIDDFKINFVKYSSAHYYAAYNGFTDEGCVKVMDTGNDSWAVIQYYGNDKEFVIPSEIDGLPVTEIHGSAFAECKSLTSVTIPDTVTAIYSEAFIDCPALKEVTIPASVEEISSHAFGYLRSGQDENYNTIYTKVDGFKINYTKNTEGHFYAADNGFTDEGCLKTYRIDSEDENVVGISKFAGGNVTSFVIPEEIDGKKVVGIDSEAFIRCPMLKEVTVPSSITYIGEHALGYTYSALNECYEKTEGFTINFEKDSEAHRYAAMNGFTDEEYLITGEYYYGEEEYVTIRQYYGGKENVTIPEEINGKKVIGIEYDAFRDNKNIKSVTIPEGVQFINSQAFFGCTSLAEVTLPESVNSVGEQAFGYYYDENTYKFEKKDGFVINYTKNSAGHLYATRNGFSDESCMYIESDDYGKFLRGYAGNDESVVIPDGVTYVDAEAFKDCDKLTEVTIPSSVNYIGNSAFENCTALETVTIPDGVATIDTEAFIGCTSLKEVTIPKSVTAIGNHALGYYRQRDEYYDFEYVKVDGFKINFVKDSEAHYYALVNGFTDEGGLFVSYWTDDSVVISKYAGNDTSYTIPSEVNGKKVVGINNEAFKDCTALQTVVIPEGVISIMAEAFDGCTALSEVVLPDSLESIDNSAFEDCPSLKEVTVPSRVSYIGDNAFGYCWDVENAEHKANADFTMKYVTNSIAHYYAKVNGFATGDVFGIVERDDDAFIRYYSGDSGTLNIPSTFNGKPVSYIDNFAFEGRQDIKNVIIPDSIRQINMEAFFGCTSLKEITIPKSVIYIEEQALGYYRDPETYESVKVDGFKIYCYAGSEGERYAADNGFDYELLFSNPTDVESFREKSKSSTAITLWWDASSGADGYILEQYKGGKWTEIADISGSENTYYTVTGLNPDTTYTFRIRAYATNDSEVLYSENYTRAAVKTRMSNVQGFGGEGVSQSAITLTWSKNDKATGYVIEQYKGGKWTAIATTKNNTTLTFTVKGLADNTAYSFRIKSYRTVNGVTDFSEYTSTKAKTLLGNVKTFTAAATGTTAIKLDWSKNDKATAYVIEQYKGGKWTVLATTKNNTTLTFTVKGLAEGTAYSFRIKSLRTVNGVTDESVYANVKATTLLSTVKDAKVTSTTGTWITLEWAKNDKATGYVIEQYKGGKWTEIATTKNNTTLKFTVKGLKNDTTYSFRMKSYKNVGADVIYSDYVRVVGKTRIPNVASFKGSAVSENEIKLDWSKNDKATGYVIEQYKGGKWTAIATINNNTTFTFTVNGLAKGTTYSFRMKSFRKTDSTTEFSEYINAKATTK